MSTIPHKLEDEDVVVMDETWEIADLHAYVFASRIPQPKGNLTPPVSPHLVTSPPLMKRRWQHFYINRTKDGNPMPVVTACMLYDGKKTYVGVAICSPTDNSSKRFARELSERRAFDALNNGCPTGFIRNESALEVLHSIAPQMIFAPTHVSFLIDLPNFVFPRV